MVNSKHAFWQALLFAIFIFGIGVLMGFFLENSRVNKVELNLLRSEINLLDEQVRGRIVEDFDLDCKVAVKNTFDFADKIYYEALKMEEYDSASKFGNQLKEVHKRYDLLRVILWDESLKLKRDCDAKFHTVVYLFNYTSEDTKIRGKQVAFARILKDLKEKHGNDVLLIPIAIDLGLSSTELVTRVYNISSAPAVIIDEKEVVRDIINLEEFESKIFAS